MTELETMIYKTALPIIRRLRKQKKWKKGIESRYIRIPFICEGVFDSLVYDTNVNDFIEIKYSKGVGQGTILEPELNHYAAYFDATETKTIPL